MIDRVVDPTGANTGPHGVHQVHGQFCRVPRTSDKDANEPVPGDGEGPGVTSHGPGKGSDDLLGCFGNLLLRGHGPGRPDLRRGLPALSHLRSPSLRGPNRSRGSCGRGNSGSHNDSW